MANTITEREFMNERVEALESMYAIMKLKHKYWRCVDTKNWSEMQDCFTSDAVFEVPARLKTDEGDSIKISGSKAIAEFLEKRLGPCITVHDGNCPEIDLLSKTEAKGHWMLYDMIIDERDQSKMTGRARYEELYVMKKGFWKIKKSKLIRLFSETIAREIRIG